MKRVGATNIATLLEEFTFYNWGAVMLQECDLPGPPQYRPLGVLGHHVVWATDAPGAALVMHRRWRGGIIGEWHGRRTATAAVAFGTEGIFTIASVHAPTSWCEEPEWDKWSDEVRHFLDWTAASFDLRRMAIGGDFNLDPIAAERGIEQTEEASSRSGRPGLAPSVAGRGHTLVASAGRSSIGACACALD